MQPILDQIDNQVRPALRKYLAAEKVLTDAQLANAAAAAVIARQDVLLAARQAADLLHHLADSSGTSSRPGRSPSRASTTSAPKSRRTASSPGSRPFR